MASYTISKVMAREVLDSRGTPTLEVELHLTDGAVGRAMVPSGASKGVHEALELRDGDPKRYLGKGTLKAVQHVNQEIAKLLVGKKFERVQAVDALTCEADGTPQKGNFGANAILGVSLAFVHAVSHSQKRPLYLTVNEMMGLGQGALSLPVPLMNILNGGLHANNGLEIQEFMIVPHGFGTFADALRAGVEIFQHLKKKLHDGHYSTAVGDEGGFAPTLDNNRQALEFISNSVTAAGYSLGKQVSLALDVAASSFYDSSKRTYGLRFGAKQEQDASGMIGYYEELVRDFPIVSIEDGIEEDDWDGWKALTRQLGPHVQIVGDDLFVTQVPRVQKGIDMGAANAVLIKVNQVGTLKETFETLDLCRRSGYRAVMSHRSGETEDVSIAHFAVASGCGQIKTGSASRSERTAKYNELLRIEADALAAGRAIPFAKVFKASS